ncbi:hypothetical protein GNZ12_04355 [Paraburkholderia sp. 1N]|uniref:Uncharacterized protein n=1 Tax=Paraburkholderia solitsugae TaxID=2675748 RepID=A0ABX2BI06_9BURK|nr:hypothetical protein [Paraburkholderia solitsugae]NPT40552.1 hypothetical protein [Paraburkholderia solitsugae]
MNLHVRALRDDLRAAVEWNHSTDETAVIAIEFAVADIVPSVQLTLVEQFLNRVHTVLEALARLPAHARVISPAGSTRSLLAQTLAFLDCHGEADLIAHLALEDAHPLDRTLSICRVLSEALPPMALLCNGDADSTWQNRSCERHTNSSNHLVRSHRTPTMPRSETKDFRTFQRHRTR